ncbi:MAG: pyridoxal phosphate enzyme (YggS family) [Halioglobus sp.]|jgi:pyridoxal phosphate enzyme (YggS family)
MTVMSNSLILQNVTKLTNRVRLAAQKSQRSPQDISIVAASKTRSAEIIEQAFDAGLTNFGENYLQEALEKIEQLRALKIVWHFIGPIQSNKTRSIAENFDWVHSVDRAKVARRLSAQRPDNLPPLQLCLQVNISQEPSKSGVLVQELPELMQEISELRNIQLRGLMAIPAATADTHQQLLAFGQMRELLESVQAMSSTMDTLSMGMSGDLEVAIAQGSTLIRVGSDIFGPRDR